MKQAPFLLLASIFAAPVFALETTAPIPTNFPAERYEALIARSPFTLATPPAAPAAPPDKGFADGWYVTSLARLDGEDFVSIKARDGGVQFSLFGTEPKDGVALQKVDWSSAVGRSTVTIVKDGQVAKLEFNQAEIAAQAQAPAAPPQNIVRAGAPNNAQRPAVPRPVQPIVQPQPYGTSLPNNNNTGIPRPNGNIQAPRPVQAPGLPNVNMQSGAGMLPNNGAPAATDGRRRIRVIQNQ